MSWWQSAVAVVAATVAAAAALVRRKPGTPEPLGRLMRERRALAVLEGPRVYYCLGAGGSDPDAPSPCGPYRPRAGEDPVRVKIRRAAGRVWLDCSGAVAWVLGVPRKIAGYARGFGWFSTDGVIKDANDPEVDLVEWVAAGEPIVPWTCLAVYGSIDKDGDGDRDSIGHIGIVAAVPDGWVYDGPASIAALSVWHCAASASPTGAVRISDGAPWARRGRLVRVV